MLKICYKKLIYNQNIYILWSNTDMDLEEQLFYEEKLLTMHIFENISQKLELPKSKHKALTAVYYCTPRGK